jgi:drug/metabolite transporter (DMT)-like permease
VLGHSSFNWALKRLKASIATIAIVGEPVGASVIAYFLLGEAPSGVQVTGAAVILTGIFLIMYRNYTVLRKQA